MNTKEYLQQIHIAKCTIDQMQQKLAMIDAELYAAKSPQFNPDRVMKSIQDNDDILRLIDKHDRLTQDIRREIDRLYNLRGKILREVDQVQDARLRQVLTERYELCHTWEQIAVNMNVTVRYVYMLHGKALEEFKKVRK